MIDNTALEITPAEVGVKSSDISSDTTELKVEGMGDQTQTGLPRSRIITVTLIIS